MSSSLKYFSIEKSFFKGESTSNFNKISSSSLKIIDYGINAFSVEHIQSNLICLNVNENLNFFKIQFLENQPPKLLKASIQNDNNPVINLKKIVIGNKDPNQEILDICLIKNIRPNCLFISAFGYPVSSKSPNKDSININFFIQYNYNNLNGFLEDLKITYFYDTYYPDDVYDFESKPIMEAVHLFYQE